MKPTSIAAGAASIGTLFLLAPAGAIQLDAVRDGPRWRVAGGRVVGSGLALASILGFEFGGRTGNDV